jgi:putative transposase
MVTPVARRQAVAHLCSSFEVSQRRACEVIGADRSSVRYLSVRPDDAAIRVRLRELATVRRRFGYRRLLLMLRVEGILLNHKKLRRLYAEERLQVRRRGGRKLSCTRRSPVRP